MQKTLEQLRDERHEAYSRTKATDFNKWVEEWRVTNRAYVAALDGVISHGRPTAQRFIVRG